MKTRLWLLLFALLAPLRRERLPNLRNIDPGIARLSADPEHCFTVPYNWFFAGIGARNPK